MATRSPERFALFIGVLQRGRSDPTDLVRSFAIFNILHRRMLSLKREAFRPPRTGNSRDALCRATAGYLGETDSRSSAASSPSRSTLRSIRALQSWLQLRRRQLR